MEPSRVSSPAGTSRTPAAPAAVPDAIMGLARAFTESRVLLTALELDLFTAVEGGATAAQAAQARGTDPAATERLLNALAAMGLLGKREGVFSPAPSVAPYLVRGGEHDAVDALLHQVTLWRTWSGLTDTVRTGRPAAREELVDRGEAWTAPFIAAMHKGAALRAPRLVEAVGAAGVRRMLDVGGGSGAYSIAFAQANPSLSAVILDLPTVLPIAEGHVGAAGLSNRVRTLAGDLRRDDLGSGFDLVLLSSICHMLGPGENRDLLRRAFSALDARGRAVVADFLLDPDRGSPRQAALFSLNMLVGTPAGDCYTEAEYAAWMREAGFAEVTRRDLPGPVSLVIGTKA